MKKKYQKKELIASFFAVSPRAQALNARIEEVLEKIRIGFVARRKLTEKEEQLKTHIVQWYGAEVLTLAGWRSDISPKLQLVKLEGKFFFGYTACGGLAPLDGETLDHFQIRLKIEEFLNDPILFLEKRVADLAA